MQSGSASWQFSLRITIMPMVRSVRRGRGCQAGREVTRSRATARKAGTSFERLIADYLAEHVDDRIDRRPKMGSKDRGDIAGVRTFRGKRAVIQCKDVAKLSLGSWYGDALEQMGNDDAEVAMVAHKRVRKGRAADQWVTMTLADLVVLLTGERPS